MQTGEYILTEYCVEQVTWPASACPNRQSGLQLPRRGGFEINRIRPKHISNSFAQPQTDRAVISLEQAPGQFRL
jgi:hypothetical protein